ncbi:hypothetical protein Tco_0818752 [Tanacetum coccineum]
MFMLISSREFNPSVGSNYAKLESPLYFGPLMQNPATDTGHRREVSLMDEDFFDYTNREVSNVGHEEYYSKMQKEISPVKGKEDNQPELVDLLGDVSDALSCSEMLTAVNTEAHPSNATEVESTCSANTLESLHTLLHSVKYLLKRTDQEGTNIRTALASSNVIQWHCSYSLWSYWFPRSLPGVRACNQAKTGSQVLVPFRGSEDSPRHLKLMGDLGQLWPRQML